MTHFDIKKTRDIATRALSPLSPPSGTFDRSAEYKVYREIPHHYYYLIFLLLVDLLGYKYVGPGEKMAYAIPVELNNKRYSVVYAKFGMKIEYYGDGEPERVFSLLQKGIHAVQKYFAWRAEQAAATSNLNLVTRAASLWEKYLYLREKSEQLSREAWERRDEVKREEFNQDGIRGTYIVHPAYEYRRHAAWTSEAAVDAFFAWTEHVLVHIAVLQCKLTTGSEVAELVKKEWSAKCKIVMDLSDPDDKASYDEISDLKSKLRNYVAHGSFGRDGAMFDFHSRVGAVPLRLLDSKRGHDFAFGDSNSYAASSDFLKIDRFTKQLFSRSRAPAKAYIESGLPTILSYTLNGRYASAMTSDGAMNDLLEHLQYQWDNAANMDF
jgi:heme-degrading monooxygenase HmoA